MSKTTENQKRRLLFECFYNNSIKVINESTSDLEESSSMIDQCPFSNHPSVDRVVIFITSVDNSYIPVK